MFCFVLNVNLTKYISYKCDCFLLKTTMFLAHLAKGNVIFCHHLASVVRRLSSVNFSHFNLLL
jgi:hypothetical protein